MNKIKIPIEICREGIELPQYANEGDAGMDVRAAESRYVRPGETVIIPTGLKVAIPEGYEIQVRPRSGVSLKTPLRIANSPGTIDSNYRDEMGIIITNTNVPNYNEDVIDDQVLINKGDRIAQLVLQEVPAIEWKQVEDVSTIGKNRNGGFGSTGIK
jgi:dUTP pyrophosphatase